MRCCHVNQALAKIVGNVVGKTCWQVLQTNQTGPCSFCTNHRLLDNNGKPTGEYRWQFRNSITGSHV